ncbi:hypothetical protein DZ858_01900 [Marixanthomonas ophiurae]|uniref:Uncharacterized protein n=2 Tax=Marixanthomonas ophiurae TaxID=387659 RepID=A0A3E1Q9P9_9FLAO|nr:hypothetical protein DZ858_01900 [Marixanthomonas ophiurae]
MGTSKTKEPATGVAYDKQEITNKTTLSRKRGARTQQEKNIKFQYVKDPKSGMVQYKMLLPIDWLIHQEPNARYFITGPNNLKVNKAEMVEFVYSNDPFTQQTLQMSGKQIAPVYPLEQVVQQFIQPAAQAEGYRYIKSYPLPKVEAFWQRFSAGMPQTGSQRQHRVLGTEWKDSNGNYSFIAIVQAITTKNQIVHWSLQTTELEAPQAFFGKAVKSYLQGVGSIEINPQWQQMMNGKLMGQIQQNEVFWATKTAESAQAHRQRMAAIQARGNTSNSIAKTYSEISDISHAGYLKRSDINSAGHSKTINTIGERTIIANHQTNEHFNVQAGSKYYWVNNNGEYIGTNNSLYDPRIDNKINGSEWVKFEKEN